MKCPLAIVLFCTVLTTFIGCQSETTSRSSGPFRVDGNTGRATGQALGINFEVFGATDVELKASKPAGIYARTTIVLADDAIIQLEMLERGSSVSLQLNGTDFGARKQGDSVVIDEQRNVTVNGTQRTAPKTPARPTAQHVASFNHGSPDAGNSGVSPRASAH